MSDGSLEGRLHSVERLVTKVDKDVAVVQAELKTVAATQGEIIEGQKHLLTVVTDQRLQDQRIGSLEEYRRSTASVLQDAQFANKFWKWIAGGSLAGILGMIVALYSLGRAAGAW